MATQKLGQLEEVDLRTIWGDESRDFTPWLAEHLDQLGEALGLDLRLIESEAGVGPFAVDILAEADEATVVIENQLERTDHSHLGQLLTYAAGRDAWTLIWITPELRDEHRAALDWLNRWTSDEIEAYGVEVRVVRIGDSEPAPEFRAVAFPNSWSRQSRARSSGSTTDSGKNERYREFFQPVVEHLHGLGLTNRRNARAQPFQSFEVGTNSIAGLRIDYNLRFWSDGSMGVKLHLANGEGWADDRLQILDALKSDASTIEEKFGAPLKWDRFENWSYSQVGSWWSGTIDDTPDKWDGFRERLKVEFPKLVEVVGPYLEDFAEHLEPEESVRAESGLDADIGD